MDHKFKEKQFAGYAISNYGSELAGDVLYCEICNKPWEDHQKSATIPKIIPTSKAWELLHILWTKAVGTPDYDKKQWMELEGIIVQAGLDKNDGKVSS